MGGKWKFCATALKCEANTVSFARLDMVDFTTIEAFEEGHCNSTLTHLKSIVPSEFESKVRKTCSANLDASPGGFEFGSRIQLGARFVSPVWSSRPGIRFVNHTRAAYVCQRMDSKGAK